MVKMIRVFFISFCILGLSSCSFKTHEKNPNQIISQPSEIQVYFTPGTDCENEIIKRLNKSDKVDTAVYAITNPDITNAIIAAHDRGANIRIVTDKTQAKGKKSLVAKIKAAGIPVLTNKKHKIEHNKFAVFDGEYVVSGSYNWTTNASNYNSENCIFLDQLGRRYSERFEYLWQLYNQ